MSPARPAATADDFEIVAAETVAPNEPRRWIKVGEKISLAWFARKRVLYRGSIHWPRLAEHDRAVVARRRRKPERSLSMKSEAPAPGDLVICETVAAIFTHYRVISAEHPFKPGGHASPRPKTFCAREAAWDTRLPPRGLDGSLTAGCRSCLTVAESRRARGQLPAGRSP